LAKPAKKHYFRYKAANYDMSSGKNTANRIAPSITQSPSGITCLRNYLLIPAVGLLLKKTAAGPVTNRPKKPSGS
jgi:hypothetical protein